MGNSLKSRWVALPESRKLDLLARMLEERGAEVVRCPLVDTRDNPDQEPVRAWLGRLIEGQLDHLVLFTGEGLRRLLPVAREMGQHAAFVAALEHVPVTARGPKPERELRQLGLRSDYMPEEATTRGLIATLSKLDLNRQRVGVQLYGTEPNEPFMAFLRAAGAEPDPVAPYIYASEAEAHRVQELIDRLEAEAVDVIAFTSSQQVQRLFRVARRGRGEEALRQALHRIPVAAVGPVVAQTLMDKGVSAEIDPGPNYFMKPLVRAIEARLGSNS